MENNHYTRILFFCNTYMQLITAIQIRTKLFPQADADILISDHSRDARQKVLALESTRLFRRVKYVETKHITNSQNVLEDCRDILTLTFGKSSKYRNMLWKENIKYDALFYFNIDILTYIAYDLCVANGVNPICVRYEEGINSYHEMASFHVGNRLRLLKKIRFMQRKKEIFESTKDFYCYYPKLFPKTVAEKNIYEIPFIKKEDLLTRKMLNTVFNYTSQQCKEKYIYFSSSFDIDGRNIREENLVKEIAALVGKDNLIVKQHPRDTRCIYEQMGLKVWKGAAIPWEIIQLNSDFSNKIFISIASSSVLNASAMLNENIKTYYLFPCIEGKNKWVDKFCFDVGKNVSELKQMGYCKNHVLADCTDEIRGEK